MSDHLHSGAGPEHELYVVWEDRALAGTRLLTLDGLDVVILSRGVRNEGAGPDFLGAVLLVGGRLVVGAVEMHLRESDWFAHGHETDPAYASVALHVLGEAPRSPALAIPTIVAAALGGRDEMPSVRIVAAPSDITRDLLVEAAWTRLLRRVTETLRSDEGLVRDERLRRAFVRRLFDCLGYSANRRPMGLIAAALLDGGVPTGLDAIAARLFGLGGCDAALVRSLAAGFMSAARLERIVATRCEMLAGVRWSRSTRPANAPERRLWGAARLLAEIVSARWLERLLDRVRAGATFAEIERTLVVRLGGEVLIGSARASEITMNAVVPVALAAGALGEDPVLIERACRLYRGAPAQQSNRIVRLIEHRYLDGRVLLGGFWQQGAIEHYQRYLSPDRSALGFVAETRIPKPVALSRHGLTVRSLPRDLPHDGRPEGGVLGASLGSGDAHAPARGGRARRADRDGRLAGAPHGDLERVRRRSD